MTLPKPRRTIRVKSPVRRLALLQVCLIALTVAAAILVIQMWFGLFPGGLAAKLITSCLVAAGLAGGAYAIADDITAERVQRKSEDVPPPS